MNLFFALAIGALFGTGATLALKADLFRVIAGLLLISNATILTVMACALSRGGAPIIGETDGRFSDPLVQAMALTALVIGFATTALLLALARQVHATHDTVDLDDLARRQLTAAEEREREEVSI